MKHVVTEATNWPLIPHLLELSHNVVHVIRLSLDLPPERWMPLTRFLNDEERVRAGRFRFDEPRQQFIICRAALRQLLGQSCGVAPSAVPLSSGRHGKPELSPIISGSRTPRIEFNVSHSGVVGLIALTIGSPVGVDVEQFSKTVEFHRLAERYFSPAETSALNALESNKQMAGFYRGWTCKEAYIKAKGSGLSHSLRSFRVEIDPDQPASLCHVDNQPDEIARWTTRSLDVGENYAATVMVAQPDCQFKCWNWEDR